MSSPEVGKRTRPEDLDPSRTVTQPKRNRGVDLARGIAMFGMFAVHVGPPAHHGGVVGGIMQAAQGRSSILFATLAGVSLALMTGGRTPKTGGDHRRALRRILIRAVLLIALGTGLKAYGTPVAVILAYYGVFFLFTVPFLKMRSRTVLIVAAAIAMIGPVAVLFTRRSSAVSDIMTRVDSLDPIDRLSGEGVTKLILTGVYPAATWLPFLLVGVVIGRFGINRLRTRALVPLGVGLMAVGYGGSALAALFISIPPDRREALSNLIQSVKNNTVDATQVDPTLLEGSAPPGWQSLFAASPHTGTIFEIVGGIGTALLILGAALWLSARFPRITWPIAAVGTMSLTIYTAHVVAINCLGLEPLPHHAGWVLVAYILTAMVVATAWLRLFDRGPLEKLMHEASVATFRRRRRLLL